LCGFVFFVLGCGGGYFLFCCVCFSLLVVWGVFFFFCFWLFCLFCVGFVFLFFCGVCFFGFCFVVHIGVMACVVGVYFGALCGGGVLFGNVVKRLGFYNHFAIRIFGR
ncbi:hypothetical protein PUR49_00035, partial [Streptomyces sp. BE147]|nr:hypothetical protein [Streptomyces sp. BE147]